MTVTEDGWLLSDSGLTVIYPIGGGYGAAQHMIVEQCLSIEDRRMKQNPKKCWKEYFK